MIFRSVLKIELKIVDLWVNCIERYIFRICNLYKMFVFSHLITSTHLTHRLERRNWSLTINSTAVTSYNFDKFAIWTTYSHSIEFNRLISLRIAVNHKIKIEIPSIKYKYKFIYYFTIDDFIGRGFSSKSKFLASLLIIGTEWYLDHFWPYRWTIETYMFIHIVPLCRRIPL